MSATVLDRTRVATNPGSIVGARAQHRRTVHALIEPTSTPRPVSWDLAQAALGRSMASCGSFRGAFGSGAGSHPAHRRGVACVPGSLTGAAHTLTMSNQAAVNRHLAGSPIGGQFAEGSRAEADPAITLEAQPLDLPRGASASFEGDGRVVEEYEVAGIGDGRYAASAFLMPVSAGELLGAGSMADHEVADVMVHGRWLAMEQFFAQRHPDTVMHRPDGMEVVFETEVEFDFEPTARLAVEGAWNAAEAVHKNLRAGSEDHVSTALLEHLDAHAFCPEFPINISGIWVPHGPMDSWEAHSKAAMANETGQIISDRAAQRLVRELSRRPNLPASFQQLTENWYARREDLEDDAVTFTDAGDRSAALALARWAAAQPTTSDTIPAQEKAA